MDASTCEAKGAGACFVMALRSFYVYIIRNHLRKTPRRDFAVSRRLEMCVPDTCEAAHSIRF